MLIVKLRVCCTSTTRHSSEENGDDGAWPLGVRVMARDGGVGGVSSNIEVSSSRGVVGAEWVKVDGETGPLRRRRGTTLPRSGILEGESAEAGDKLPLSAFAICTGCPGRSGGVIGTAVEDPLEPDLKEGVRGVSDCLLSRLRRLSVLGKAGGGMSSRIGEMRPRIALSSAETTLRKKPAPASSIPAAVTAGAGNDMSMPTRDDCEKQGWTLPQQTPRRCRDRSVVGE